jgi:hypothetical protein
MSNKKSNNGKTKNTLWEKGFDGKKLRTMLICGSFGLNCIGVVK